ncbi:MAG TPA: hypothetical protein VGC39_09240, partial [Candidatus Methylacidiphilales bacterium]
MKYFFRFLLSLSGAVICRGLRFGPREFIKSGFAGLAVVQPFQARAQKEREDLLQAMPQTSLSTILGERRPEIALTLQAHEDGMLGLPEAVALL